MRKIKNFHGRWKPFFCNRMYLLIFSDPNFIIVVCALFSIILLNSLNREARCDSQSKAKEQHGKVKISSANHEWLNHEWMLTYDVDVQPFNEATFPLLAPEGEFSMK